MLLKKTHSLLYLLVVIAVVAIIGVSLTLSGLAVAENMRFVHATDQLFQLVNLVRSTAATQKDFATTVGEDVFGDLQHQGQILPSTITPWGGVTRASLAAANMMRVDIELPTTECRRMALRFMDYQAADIGLLGIQAQAPGDAVWTPVYPLPPHTHISTQLGTACGKAPTAHLGLIFQLR